MKSEGNKLLLTFKDREEGHHELGTDTYLVFLPFLRHKLGDTSQSPPGSGWVVLLGQKRPSCQQRRVESWGEVFQPLRRFYLDGGEDDGVYFRSTESDS